MKDLRGEALVLHNRVQRLRTILVVARKLRVQLVRNIVLLLTSALFGLPLVVLSGAAAASAAKATAFRSWGTFLLLMLIGLCWLGSAIAAFWCFKRKVVDFPRCHGVGRPRPARSSTRRGG